MLECNVSYEARLVMVLDNAKNGLIMAEVVDKDNGLDGQKESGHVVQCLVKYVLGSYLIDGIHGRLTETVTYECLGYLLLDQRYIFGILMPAKSECRDMWMSRNRAYVAAIMSRIYGILEFPRGHFGN